jgi:hypothetical protein
VLLRWYNVQRNLLFDPSIMVTKRMRSNSKF